MLWSAELEMSEAGVKPSDERFAAQVDRLAQERLPRVKADEDYESVSVQSVDIQGRTWVQHRLRRTPADDKEAYRTHLYTVYKGSVIVFTYTHTIDSWEREEDEKTLEQEEEDLHRIAGTLELP